MATRRRHRTASASLGRVPSGVPRPTWRQPQAATRFPAPGILAAPDVGHEPRASNSIYPAPLRAIFPRHFRLSSALSGRFVIEATADGHGEQAARIRPLGETRGSHRNKGRRFVDTAPHPPSAPGKEKRWERSLGAGPWNVGAGCRRRRPSATAIAGVRDRLHPSPEPPCQADIGT